jgi:hypothetical protein
MQNFPPNLQQKRKQPGIFLFMNKLAPSNKSSTFPLSRLSASLQPINQEETLQAAKLLLGAVAQGKLQLLVEQINFLHQQARRVMEEADSNLQLHQVQCSFQKRAGHQYYLYLKGKPEEQCSLYFSLLSPQDWEGNPPHSFQGAFLLQEDLSWIKAE